jgi:excisionase family DNA binding protein
MAHPTNFLTLKHKSSGMMSQPATVSLNSFEELLDLRQAAQLLGMHWKTLEIMARGRRVPALKVGKRWRFRLSSLNRWLDDEINSNTTNHAALTGQE